MKSPTYLSLAALVVSSALLAGCSDDGGGDVSSGEVKIGVPLSLSGPVAFAGVSQREGIELAFEQAADELDEAGIDPELVFRDDKSDQATGTQVTTSLAERDQVAAILGYSASNICQAALPLGEEYKVPTVNANCSAPGLSGLGDYVFNTAIPFDAAVTAMVDQLVSEQGVQRAAVLYLSENPSTEAVTEAMRQAFDAQGVELVADESIATSAETDFNAQMTRIADADPDVLGLMVLGSAAGPAMTQARAAGLDDVVFIGADNLASDVVIEAAGKDAVGTRYGTFWSRAGESEVNQAFVESFTAEYAKAPDSFAANGFAGARVLIDAMLEAGAPEGDLNDYRDALQESLAGLTDFETIYGSGTASMESNDISIPQALVVEIADSADGPAPQLVDTVEIGS